MAATNLPVNPSFLVFPTGSAEFAWRIVALATGRTIARYKHLDHAVERAKLLNFPPPPVLPEPQFAERPILWTRGFDLGTCQHWYDTAYDPANPAGCDRSAMVTDLETGCGFCVEHWKEFQS